MLSKRLLVCSYFALLSQAVKDGCADDCDCPDNEGCVNKRCVDPCLGRCHPYSSCQITDHEPHCANEEGPVYGAQSESCKSKDECPDNEACVNGHCVDPCVGHCVNNNTVCVATNHTPNCCPQGTGHPSQRVTPEGCNYDMDCPKHEACRNRKCIDPCEEWCLQDNTVCFVTDHKPDCACLPHHSGEPAIGCTPERCQNSMECPSNQACVNRKCVDICEGWCLENNTVCFVNNHKPDCACLPHHTGDPTIGCTPDKCKNDIQCSKKEACVTGKCVDPCEGHCHKDNTACYVSNHKPQCVCLHNYVGDPHQGCRPEGCSKDIECPNHEACVNNRCKDPCENRCLQSNTVCYVKNHYANCACLPNHTLHLYLGCIPDGCKNNKDCLANEKCIMSKCVDPCVAKCLYNNTVCYVTDHTPQCACLPHYVGDPSRGCKPAAIKKSPKGYFATNGRYFLYDTKLNWYKAMDLCAANGLQGATFQTKEEYELLVAFIKNKGGSRNDYWVGGSDLAETDRYVWLATGETLNYTVWQESSRDHQQCSLTHKCIPELEHCIEINTGKFQSKMNDFWCFHGKNNFICETRNEV